MLKLVGIFALVSAAYAAVSIYPAEPKPAEFASEEGCYLSNLQRVLPYQVPYYPGDSCEQYVCQRNNQTLRESCGAIGTGPGCTISAVDLTKIYPDCCGTQVCPSTPAPTTQAATTPAPPNQGSFAYASAQASSGQVPTTQEPTTQTPTTQAPTTPTTQAPTTPTTQAPTTPTPTTQAPTTQAPTTQNPAQEPPNQGSSAYASAQSVGGQAPVITTYTSGPDAQASANAS